MRALFWGFKLVCSLYLPQGSVRNRADIFWQASACITVSADLQPATPQGRMTANSPDAPDPVAGVQLAYDAKLAHALMVHPARQPSGKKFIPQSSWAEVLANPIPAARFPTRFVNNCCQHFARFLLLCQQRNVLRTGNDSPASWLSGTPLRPLVLPAWAHL